MSSRKTAGRRGTTKKRAQRATSNVFAMFNQDQIQEFKEAFNMIDHNRDGFIDNEDLHDMLASLGKDPTDEYLDSMMNEAPGPINFTMFLTMFGERLQGTDPEEVIKVKNKSTLGCSFVVKTPTLPQHKVRFDNKMTVDHHPPTHRNFSGTSRRARELKFGTDTH